MAEDPERTQLGVDLGADIERMDDIFGLDTFIGELVGRHAMRANIASSSPVLCAPRRDSDAAERPHASSAAVSTACQCVLMCSRQLRDINTLQDEGLRVFVPLNDSQPGRPAPCAGA